MKQLPKKFIGSLCLGSDGNRKFFCAVIRGHDGI